MTLLPADSSDPGGIEGIAREHCARLLQSKAARSIPTDVAEGLVILAFTFGAAWALERPDMIELAHAQFDSIKAQHQ